MLALFVMGCPVPAAEGLLQRDSMQEAISKNDKQKQGLKVSIR
jgi:hypothetical protein